MRDTFMCVCMCMISHLKIQLSICWWSFFYLLVLENVLKYELVTVAFHSYLFYSKKAILIKISPCILSIPFLFNNSTPQLDISFFFNLKFTRKKNNLTFVLSFFLQNPLCIIYYLKHTCSLCKQKALFSLIFIHKWLQQQAKGAKKKEFPNVSLF